MPAHSGIHFSEPYRGLWFTQLFACFKELILNAFTEPEKSQVEMMLNGITSDMLAPLVRMSDKGELPIIAAQWSEVSSHIKQQVAAVYFGTHPRLEELEGSQ